jgi:hypothetical protein
VLIVAHSRFAKEFCRFYFFLTFFAAFSAFFWLLLLPVAAMLHGVETRRRKILAQHRRGAKRMDELKRTYITVSASEITLIKKLKGAAEAYCSACRARVEMATIEQAVTMTGLHSRAIYGWVERGLIHFLETAEGHLLICLPSLRDAQKNSCRETQKLESPDKSLPAEE